MKNQLLLFSTILLASISLKAQPNFEKVKTKADKYISKSKYEKADQLLSETLQEAPYWGEGWDKLSKLKLFEWELAKREDKGLSFTLSTTDEDGNEIQNDSLTNVFAELLGRANPATIAYNEAINSMNLALIHNNTAYMTSIYLRNYSVDQYPDTAISKEAMNYFYKAETEFSKRNFAEAAQLYQKALDIEPKFYKASLYLGDSYYALEYYAQAIDKFKEAIEKFPNELEPRKYLADAFFYSGLYEKSLNAACEAIAVYPDLTMLANLQNIAKYNDKSLQLDWTPRAILPNRMNRKEQVNQIMTPWTFYTEAFENIKNQCNSNGIIEYSDLTNTRYLEVYCWEEMLKKSNDPILDNARKMQEKGYLDCYVFVNCFHQDFYEQYQDFVANNPGRVEAYLKSQMK